MNSRNLTALISTALICACFATPAMAGKKYCDDTAKLVKKACYMEARDDWYLASAICNNIPDGFDRAECDEESAGDYDETRDECGDQYDARLDLCDALGQERYAPDWDPENFVDPRNIGNLDADPEDYVEPNQYLPLIEGMVRMYVKDFEEDGELVHEEITVTITDEIKDVDGVECRTVQDTVFVDGQLLEDTDDWFAQDVDGNVWYCGEEVKDYEYFDGDDPEIPELISTDGAFKAGRDGDLPGILALADPQVGDVYREEMSFNNAEDASEILTVTGSAETPAASCDETCMVARAFSPLEPGHEEEKFYAPGIGPILELDEEGNRTELVFLFIP